MISSLFGFSRLWHGGQKSALGCGRLRAVLGFLSSGWNSTSSHNKQIPKASLKFLISSGELYRMVSAANPSSPSCRREAVPLHVGELRLAFRPFRRADPALQEAHRGEALQVHSLQPLLLPLGPPGSAHEAPPELTPSSPRWRSGAAISPGPRDGVEGEGGRGGGLIDF